jgi:hypothetical protein
MKLTTEQLTEIKAFIKNKGYPEPDLLLEMLDHVACMVEEKMKASPDLSFDSALKNTYSDFGFWGFSKLADGLIKGRKTAIKGTVKRVLRLFTLWPYILLVIVSAFILFYGYTFIYKPFIVGIPIVILITYFGYYFSVIRPAAKPFKEYLWIESTNHFSFFISLGLNLFLPFVYLASNSPAWAIIYSVWILSLSLCIICYFVYYNEALKKCKELQQVYGGVL